MKFKIGDKVKFLNESGGGIVSEIVSPSMVKVAVEDGFDIPYMTHDLVLVESSGYAEGMFNEDFKVEPKSVLKTEETGLENIAIPSKSIKHAKEEAGIYLAVVPHDQKWLITGDVDVYLLNHTAYDILYSLFLKSDERKFEGYDYSSVEPESSVLLDTFSREAFEAWKEGLIQVLYHKDEVQQVLLPVHTNFKIRQNKLNNENSYQYTSLVDSKAYVISLNELSQQQKANTFLGKDDDIKEQKATEKKEKALIDQHQTLPKIAEVDLHIAELVENISGMDTRDMFALQKKYFKDCLDSAIVNNYKKVTFIHGVGNGRLKNAIIEILKQYEDVENQSASIAKYGVGAIDVLIKPWK